MNCARKRAIFISVPHSLSSPQTRSGHIGIVTLSSKLASTSMRWLKITIFRLLVANAEAFLMQEQGDCSPLIL